jgi:hypothetical protein
MAAEMEAHLAERTDDLISRGLSPAEAVRQARLEFGAVQHYREECRSARGWRWMDEFLGDIRYVLRQHRRSPTFAALAIVVLDIGIGANTALFSAIDAVLLRLPVQHPEQLRQLEWCSKEPDFCTGYSGRIDNRGGGSRVSLGPVLVGIALGVITALASGRLVQSMLFGLAPNDPATLFGVGLALCGSALFAAWVPASRASRITPMEALLYE